MPEVNTERTRSAAWLRIAVAAAVVVAFMNVLAIGVVALTPERCASCHVSSEEALEVREAHSSIACLDCHGGTTVLAGAGFASREVYGMYLRLPIFSDRSTAIVSDAVCSGCHAVTSEVSDETAIRIDHATCTVDRDCADCHSRVAHGDSVTWPRSFDMFDCVQCHMADATAVECDLCHTERSRDERVRTGMFALTHAANWRQTHGMGDSLACAACHPADKCVGCHGSGVPHQAAFAKNHGDFAVDEDAQCESCHTQSFCDDCHGLTMPHPGDFAPEHSALVNEQGRETCENCHAPSDCMTCHVKHVHPGNTQPPGGE
ncbi:MAG: hypothetical protein JXE06_04030 [Coriobacteriia bacterium]|nr:hypothetical protein [Coriobacteriia bacterium]MBN2823360.1 hypothetical protein [Coriobacteriia bacterium]